MTEKDDGSALAPTDGGGERKLSIPYSVQRRKYGSGSETRVVVVAVDPSECAKSAFMWYLKNIWRKDDLAKIAAYMVGINLYCLV